MKKTLLLVISVILAQQCFAAYSNTAGTRGYLKSIEARPAVTTGTITGWFKVGATGSTACVMAYKGNNFNNGWGFYIPSGSRTPNILLGNVMIMTGTIALSADTWTSVTLTRSGNNYELFVDGVSSVSGTGSAIDPGTDFLALGDFGASSPPAMSVAEIGFFDRALTSAEITELSKGLRPLNLGNIQEYWPLVASLNEWINRWNFIINESGVSVSDHPRVYN